MSKAWDIEVTLTLALILVTVRICMVFQPIPPSDFTWVDVYKDAAHLFVGGLGGAWLVSRRRWQWELFWCLTIVETICAIVTIWLRSR